jgi:hypothetical protein
MSSLDLVFIRRAARAALKRVQWDVWPARHSHASHVGDRDQQEGDAHRDRHPIGKLVT